MRAYFSPIFNRNGFAHNYCCPGCIAEKRPNKTMIPADIIQYLIPIYIPNEKITEVVDQINQTFQTINVKRTLNSEANCHFAINPGEIRCSKSAKVNNIGTCGHRICLDCLIKYVESKNTIENLKCIVDDCERFMPHTLIRESLKMNEDLLNKYWLQLRIGGKNLINCINCNKRVEIPSEDRIFKCDCGAELCALCNQNSHGFLSCVIANDKRKEYREYPCAENDPSLDFRNYYLQAVSLFEWDLHHKGRAKITR